MVASKAPCFASILIYCLQIRQRNSNTLQLRNGFSPLIGRPLFGRDAVPAGTELVVFAAADPDRRLGHCPLSHEKKHKILKIFKYGRTVLPHWKHC